MRIKDNQPPQWFKDLPAGWYKPIDLVKLVGKCKTNIKFILKKYCTKWEEYENGKRTKGKIYYKE